ncbi:MAG: S8 family serine peptidase, partial [Spirochaetales bacterium]|nr:S8 family serine peptidase [Spirochaetales bacterium]
MKTPARILIVLLMALTLVLTFSGCNLVLSRAPGLYVLENGLGEFESRPTWFWEVYGPDLVQAFRYSFGSEGDWTEVDGEIRRFRPVNPLGAGTYTLYLQAKSISGLWSRTVSKTATVATSEPFRPNDLYFNVDEDTDWPGQWALEVMGIPALWGHLKHLEETGTTRQEVVVAVVDTGYTEHPDLQDGPLDNLLEENGYDFIEDIVSAADDDGIDDDALDAGDGGFGENSWHGTAVAGAIAALTNNGVGIAGIGLSKLKVLPVRALGYEGGTTEEIANAIRYAAGLANPAGEYPSKTAKIINLSLGGGGADTYFEETLAAVTAKGIIVVASA